MILPFTRDGETGRVTVDLEQVDEPLTVGKHPDTRGFPCCTAVVDYPSRGYRSLFGWVQLVRSTDNSSSGVDFEMDPFALFEDAPSPYAFFGVNPTLFDAPSRSGRPPMAWLAHSFLAWTPLDRAQRQVLPVVGFSWGFDIDATGHITFRPAKALTAVEWDGHLPYLSTCHSAWKFDEWQAETAWPH
ncbi:hypothetical protein P3T27_004345 [Kitasatospora sp. MAA19]|uniref:hypothetical protein n=1 Tax=Kitasatospora sp. MAA19 TaxID=3035090 RepID=UPI002473DCAD|nr:hypothetical protein [Kitasatospora sp. MAA19]MDH6707608.1 hypothetical protein [Kitasatospora sp. MAA19]